MSEPRDPIDASLQRLFALPDLGALQAKIDATAAELPRIEPARAARRWRARMLGVAAIAAGAAAAIVLVLAGRGAPDVAPAPKVAALDDARRHAGARLVGFYRDGAALPRADDDSCLASPPPPPASCIDDAAEPRVVMGDALELVGECGARGGPSCAGYDVPVARLVHLRVREGGPDVLVCVEPRARDPQPVLPADGGLQMFRRELGAFVLYEITPLPEPFALDRFEL